MGSDGLVINVRSIADNVLELFRNIILI